MKREFFALVSALYRMAKRPSFWLALSVCGNAITWLLMLNSSGSLNPGVPQTIFRIQVPYDVSINLALLELAGVFFFGLILMVTLTVSLIMLMVRRVTHQPTQGFCPVCSYDLRATPDRCPECGTPVIRAKGVREKIGTISN